MDSCLRGSSISKRLDPVSKTTGKSEWGEQNKNIPSAVL